MKNDKTYILNFFFDSLCDENKISFEYEFSDVLVENSKLKILCQFTNSKENLEAEKQFTEFNSIANRQSIGHNFKAAVETGKMIVDYSDFSPEQTIQVDTAINDFLQYKVSYILTFFQRRRVILGKIKAIPSSRYVLSLGLYTAAELVDSVGYGEPLIKYTDTQSCLTSAIKYLSSLSKNKQDTLEMLLLRYNETLNLPYSYERIESYWRILECLSDATTLTVSDTQEYERLKTVIGMTKNSKTLKVIVKTLIDYAIPYNDQQVKDSFDYRNLSTHEYLNKDLTMKSYLSDIFKFLNKAVELVILSHLNIASSFHNESQYSLMTNRVF